MHISTYSDPWIGPCGIIAFKGSFPLCKGPWWKLGKIIFWVKHVCFRVSEWEEWEQWKGKNVSNCLPTWVLEGRQPFMWPNTFSNTDSFEDLAFLQSEVKEGAFARNVSLSAAICSCSLSTLLWLLYRLKAWTGHRNINSSLRKCGIIGFWIPNVCLF